MGHLLGIDIGTSGCKASLVDAQGRVLGSGYAAYSLERPAPDRVEIDPDRWWVATRQAVRAALASDAGAVAGIGLSSSNATVLLDAHGRPVAPAMMQLDRRATEQAGRLPVREVLTRAGVAPQAGVTWLANLAWLRERQPGAFAATARVVFPSGFIGARLTGVAAVDLTRAGTTGLFDPISGGWCPDLAELAGVDVAVLPPLLAPEAVLGLLRPGPARELGLRAGTPVAMGAMDSAAAALAAGAVDPGDSVVILGTMARVVTVADDFAPRAGVLTCRHALDGALLELSVLWGAGRCLSLAAAQGHGRPDYDWLDRAARDIAPGADGLRYEPPRDGAVPSLPAGLCGRRARHTPAHVARAIVEGVLRTLLELGSKAPDSVTLTGGGASGRLAGEILADMLGVSVRVPRSSVAAEPVGAAICAAAAADVHTTVGAATRAMAAPMRTIEPDPAVHLAYVASR